MVKIAVAGGSGHIASEIIDVLAATKKHEILILSRNDPVAGETRLGVTWAKVDYTNKEQVVRVLEGVHTVLSFTVAHMDPGSVAQKMLIDASIAAGVKRFAPSEWSSSSLEGLPWYAGKGEVREYLAEINKEKKVLEYTLFQPGLLANYSAPAGTCKHIEPTELFIDFLSRRAIILDGVEGYASFITMADITNVVARAIDYPGEWPVIGGIRGKDLSFSDFIEIGVKARGGKPWDITRVKLDDVRAGDIKAPWLPLFVHPNMPKEEIIQFSKIILQGCLLSGVAKSWVVSDEWNRLLPDYKFTDIEEFFVKSWAGQP